MTSSTAITSIKNNKKLLVFIITFFLTTIITSFFVEKKDVVLARIINQIPILVLLYWVFVGVKRKLFLVEKFYGIIFLMPPIKHFLLHYFEVKAFTALQNITDLVFSFASHSLFLIIFRIEGGSFFADSKFSFFRILPSVSIVILLFIVQLGTKMPDNFFVIYAFFVFLIICLLLTCDSRRIHSTLRIIGNIGLYLVLFCTYFALYNRMIHEIPHNYVIYRNSYYIGIFLLYFSSFWNLELKYNHPMKAHDG